MVSPRLCICLFPAPAPSLSEHPPPGSSSRAKVRVGTLQWPCTDVQCCSQSSQQGSQSCRANPFPGSLRGAAFLHTGWNLHLLALHLLGSFSFRENTVYRHGSCLVSRGGAAETRNQTHVEPVLPVAPALLFLWRATIQQHADRLHVPLSVAAGVAAWPACPGTGMPC